MLLGRSAEASQAPVLGAVAAAKTEAPCAEVGFACSLGLPCLLLRGQLGERTA